LFCKVNSGECLHCSCQSDPYKCIGPGPT
jgi:hypothetical protein